MFQTLDKALRAASWRYDACEESFYAGDKRLPYRKVLALVPGMTLDELASYQDGGFGASGMGRTAKATKKVARKNG